MKTCLARVIRSKDCKKFVPILTPILHAAEETIQIHTAILSHIKQVVTRITDLSAID
jgi:hypothetical protein